MACAKGDINTVQINMPRALLNDNGPDSEPFLHGVESTKKQQFTTIGIAAIEPRRHCKNCAYRDSNSDQLTLESGALTAYPFPAGALISCRAVYFLVHCALVVYVYHIEFN